MILNQRETTIAYRCPHCGSFTKSMVGAFLLSSDMMRLKCPCGESEMTVVQTRDKKMRLTVPCFVCPTPHVYQVSATMFYERELFALNCAMSGLDIGFFGKAEQVEAAIDEADEALRELMAEADIASFDSFHTEPPRRQLTDPQVFDIVSFVISDLRAEGKITCRCEDAGEYAVEIGDDHILVHCETCGAEKRIPAESLTQAMDFLECESLVLE